MLEQIEADLQRVRAQATALEGVRDRLSACAPTAWTGEAGTIATNRREELRGEVESALTTLRGIEGRLIGLTVRIDLEGAPGVGALRWVG
ncbi:hypothetical protein ACPYO6_05255 [Georgenia sp. Z1344]|uniref:hypothetical protein n=1 Tax=Georgenia sp. Z1344 TaxID=3416706 RepID=UPI003CF9F84B